MKVSYNQLINVVTPLFTSIIKKAVMVLIALIVTIPFFIKFHVVNATGYWILELCLWMVWIKETVNWKDFKDLLNKIKK